MSKGKTQQCSETLTHTHFPSAAHPLPKPKCFSMTVTCIQIWFAVLFWGRLVSSMSLHGKNGFLHFFPLVAFLPFVLLCTIITVLFGYIALFLSLCADQACWKWKAVCNLLKSLIVVLQVSWITDYGKFWSEVLYWSINWTTAGERTKAISYLMFMETCSQFFMEDCCCTWIY